MQLGSPIVIARYGSEIWLSPPQGLILKLRHSSKASIAYSGQPVLGGLSQLELASTQQVIGTILGKREIGFASWRQLSTRWTPHVLNMRKYQSLTVKRKL